MTDLDALTNAILDESWAPPEPDDMALERRPKRHRHEWSREDYGICERHNIAGEHWGCMRCPAVRDRDAHRRGKSSRRLGHDGERRSEKRYGWRKVGEYGGITDLEGTLAIVQQKTSRRTAPVAWKSIFAALEGRAGGRIPLVLLSFVKVGIDTEDFIVIRGRDWLQLHGKDAPNEPGWLHANDPGYPTREDIEG